MANEIGCKENVLEVDACGEDICEDDTLENHETDSDGSSDEELNPKSLSLLQEVIADKECMLHITKLFLKHQKVFKSRGGFDTDSEESIGDTQSVEENEEGELKPKALWTSLFKDNRVHENGIKLSRVDNIEGKVSIANDDLDDLNAWGFCLIGYFASNFPGKVALDQICKSWGVPYEYTMHGSGWLVFKFQKEEDRNKVLVEGPYFIYGKQLLVKIMPKLFQFDNKELTNVPIWINLYGLPLECWNAKVLSQITSLVGKPICTDKLTSTKDRINYARVLVEVDVSKDLVREVQIEFQEGSVRDQKIVYEFEPKYCGTCTMFGHSTQDCILNKPKDAAPTEVEGNFVAANGQNIVGTRDVKRGQPLWRPNRNKLQVQGNGIQAANMPTETGIKTSAFQGQNSAGKATETAPHADRVTGIITSISTEEPAETAPISDRTEPLQQPAVVSHLEQCNRQAAGMERASCSRAETGRTGQIATVKEPFELPLRNSYLALAEEDTSTLIKDSKDTLKVDKNKLKWKAKEQPKKRIVPTRIDKMIKENPPLIISST